VSVLGVNVVGEVAYCVILDGDEIVEAEPFKLEVPPGVAFSDGLVALSGHVEFLVSDRDVSRITVVAAENSYSDTYVALAPRIGIETAILIAGARAGIAVERMPRPEVRSRLGLPKSGKLSDLCGQVTQASGKFWRNKRDIAALGAIAGRSAS
jgi:hypothetical protein